MWLSILYTPKLAAVVIRIRQSAIINPVTSEGEDANTTLDVGIPIEVDITPDDALLQSSIVVFVAVDAASSTATGRVGKMKLVMLLCIKLYQFVFDNILIPAC